MKIVNQEDNHCLIITEEFELFKLWQNVLRRIDYH